MGSYTYGELGVTFNRELTEPEYVAWQATCKGGRPIYYCANTAHEGAPLNAEGQCEHYDPTPGAAGYCYKGFEVFDPEGWAFGDDEGGDIGVAGFARNGFTITSGGKVYDLTDAAAWFVECLPADVMAFGTGTFETEGEHWGITVHDREVREVSAAVYTEDEIETIRREARAEAAPGGGSA